MPLTRIVCNRFVPPVPPHESSSVAAAERSRTWETPHEASLVYRGTIFTLQHRAQRERASLPYHSIPLGFDSGTEKCDARVHHQYVHSSTTQYTESLLHGYGLRPGVKPSLYLLLERPVALAKSVLAAVPGSIPRCWNARHPRRTAASASPPRQCSSRAVRL